MSEESGNQTEELALEESGISASDVRNHDLFRRVVSEKDSKLDAAMKELTQLRETVEQEARRKDMEKKEAAGQYEQIREKLEAENAALRAEYDQQMRTLRLESALTKEGADEYFTSWAISNFQGNDIEEYVNSLKTDEKHSQRFNLAAQVNPGNPHPAGAVPAGRSPGNWWNQVRQDLSSRDRSVRDAAHAKIMEHMNKTGKMPW